MRKREIWAAAYKKALNRLARDKRMTATEISCGRDVLVIPGKKQAKTTWEEVQVFMKICRFDEKLLKEKPMTGGLLCYNKGRKR